MGALRARIKHAFAVDAPGGPHDDAPGAAGACDRVTAVRVACADLNVNVKLLPQPAATLWRRPIETVSQSERGFERSYQGTSLVFSWVAEVGGDGVIEAMLVLRVGR